MGKICVLDQNTINQIAAGEVIERPMSVVKELLENAIDAGATAVTVEIKDGGLTMMRITDNGSGIAEDDIHNAFLPHATSKIRDAADLVSISSLGFRGEALASIAAVAKVELITKTRDSITGISYVIEGGEEKECTEIGAADGTTFIVRDIFFNTPARRKFLKSAQTEGVYISELVERIALSRPDISIRLIMNGQSKLFTVGNGKQKDAIYAVFGREIANSIIPLKHKLTSLTITGFVGKPVINRGNRAMEIFFINGRYVKCKMVYKAIEDAYKPFMMQHKYPFCVINIDIAPELLDVNVHPAKMELRFRQEETLYRELVGAINGAVRGQELVVETTPDKEDKIKTSRSLILNESIQYKSEEQKPKFAEPFENNRMVEENTAPVPKVESLHMAENAPVEKAQMPTPAPYYSPIPTYSSAPRQGLKMPDYLKAAPKEENVSVEKTEPSAEVTETLKASPEKENETVVTETVTTAEHKEEITNVSQLELFDDTFISKKARSRHKLIGQIFGTYWIVEYEDKMFMIDQHAAHEKILFEHTMAAMQSREASSQMISPSIVLHLSDRQANTLEENLEYFRKLGFEIDNFGGNAYTVSALPANLFSLNQVDLLMELIDDLSDELTHGSNQTILDKVATMSCKAAVKGHTKLTEAEANELIDELLTLDNPYACPHGRPTIISMSKYEIEKKFKRIV